MPKGIKGFVKGASGNPSGRAKRGSEEIAVQTLARAHTVEAMETLLEVMRCKDAAHSARTVAANSLLDRGWGKPITPVSNPDLTPLDLGDLSDEQLDDAIARIEQRLSLGTSSGSLQGSAPRTH